MPTRITARRITAAACAAGVGIALAACSTDTSGAGGSGGGSGSAAISIVSSTTAPEQAVIDLFHKQNPDITVKTTTAPGPTYSQVVATQLAGGSAADVVRGYPGDGANISVIQGTKKGFFADLSSLSFAKDVPAPLKPVLTDGSGKVSAVPLTTSAIGGVYNRTVLQKLGVDVPTTWTQVLSYCRAVKAKGVTPYGLGLKDAFTGQFVPYALAATLLPADFAKQQAAGKATFSDSAWRTAFQKYVQMKDAGCFTAKPNGTSYANVEDQIGRGEAAGSVTLSLTIADIQKAAPSGTDIAFAPLPATDDAAQTKLSDGIGVVFSLNAKSKNPAAAKKLLDFMATPAAQAAYATAAATSPALDAGSGYKGDTASKVIAQYTDDGKVAAWPDQSWPNPTVQQAHFDGVQGIFAGSRTVDQVLSAMDKAYGN